MAYLDATFTGAGGISKVFTGGPYGAVVAGAVSCAAGDCYARKLKTATVTTSGTNSAIANPNPSNGPAFVDGWVHLNAGATHEFGGERLAEGAGVAIDPVQQIDIWLNADPNTGLGEVTISAH